MRKLLDEKGIMDAFECLASQIKESIADFSDVVVLGIQSRGEIVGKRLAELLNSKFGIDVVCGSLDITLHRDDFDDPHGDIIRPVGKTDIPCDINNKIIILADDVLHTGRSCRAAFDAIVAYGRPAKIRLGVLVDRGHREFPIQADYIGCHAEVKDSENICVHFKVFDDKDEVDVVSIN